MCTSKLNSPAARKCIKSITAARTLRALKTYSSLQSQGESLITLITFRRRWTNRMLTYPPLVPLPRNMSELPKSAEICRQLSFFAFLVSLYIL